MQDFDPNTYPSRRFIRFTAERQLMADATGQPNTMTIQRLGRSTYVQTFDPDPSIGDRGAEELDDTEEEVPAAAPSATPMTEAFAATDAPPANGIDETLFAEIVETVFQPNHHPELYQACATVTAAGQVEVDVATEIVEAYRHIKRNESSLRVQRLNRLMHRD